MEIGAPSAGTDGRETSGCLLGRSPISPKVRPSIVIHLDDLRPPEVEPTPDSGGFSEGSEMR